MNKTLATLLFGCLLGQPAAFAEDALSEYRDMLGDENPAIFVVDDGEDSWHTARGPKNATLEACDLGLGAGVVKGAYAQLPRWFADTGRVMDVEARLVHCAVTLQGRSAEELTGHAYSDIGQPATELESLVTWIAAQSEGVAIAAPQAHEAERAAHALGQELFFYRAGPHDFSCASCHRQSGKRIRLQELPNLTTAEGAGGAYSNWPAYRISQGIVRTMGWRMRDCARQQRLPELQIGSEASVALQTFMAVNAAGAAMNAPGLKR